MIEAVFIILLFFASFAEARDAAQVRAFRKANPCPSTGKVDGACPNYVVDHIIPLATYGADRPDNMQWQTVEAAKKKDKLEYRAYRARVAAEKHIRETCDAIAAGH